MRGICYRIRSGREVQSRVGKGRGSRHISDHINAMMIISMRYTCHIDDVFITY